MEITYGAAATVIAVSGQPFPMPAEPATLAAGGMPWDQPPGAGVALYCLHSNVVIAAPVLASELPALVHQLPQSG